MALQAITVPDDRYAEYLRSVDFIRQDVFPGSCLVSITAMQQSAERTRALRASGFEDLTPHYARTLREWRARFESASGTIAGMGFDETFQRLWHWYFCYCEAGFLERTVGLLQLVLAGPRAGAGLTDPSRAGLP